MSAVKQKTLYDRNRGTPKSKIVSTVWLYYPPHAKRKFGKGWTGPYLITGKVSDLCYIIPKFEQAKALVVYVDHLKEYQGLRPLQSWLTVENDKRQAQVELQPFDQAAKEGETLSHSSAAWARKWTSWARACGRNRGVTPVPVTDLLNRVWLRRWMGKRPTGLGKGAYGGLSSPSLSFVWPRRLTSLHPWWWAPIESR